MRQHGLKRRKNLALPRALFPNAPLSASCDDSREEIYGPVEQPKPQTAPRASRVQVAALVEERCHVPRDGAVNKIPVARFTERSSDAIVSFSVRAPFLFLASFIVHAFLALVTALVASDPFCEIVPADRAALVSRRDLAPASHTRPMCTTSGDVGVHLPALWLCMAGGALGRLLPETAKFFWVLIAPPRRNERPRVRKKGLESGRRGAQVSDLRRTGHVESYEESTRSVVFDRLHGTDAAAKAFLLVRFRHADAIVDDEAGRGRLARDEARHHDLLGKRVRIEIADRCAFGQEDARYLRPDPRHGRGRWIHGSSPLHANVVRDPFEESPVLADAEHEGHVSIYWRRLLGVVGGRVRARPSSHNFIAGRQLLTTVERASSSTAVSHDESL